MKSIKGLFEETKNESNGYEDRLSRRLRYFDENSIQAIPKLQYPLEGSREFKEDLSEVERCHYQPSLNTSFLKNTDDSVEDIFRKYCEEEGVNNIDWKTIKDILEDVDSIVLKLKFKNKRPRPIEFIDNRHDLDVKYKKSPSFPSGHTAIAYFLSGIISDHVPEIKQSLQTLSSLIGQSRIENAVHFPTDIMYGRLVGETLADILVSQNQNLNLSKTLKAKHYKKFSDHVLEKANSAYKDNHLENLIEDIAYFLYRTNSIEKKHADYSECKEASKMLLSGYPSKYITNNHHLSSQIDCMVAGFKCGKIDNPYKAKYIHSFINDNCLDKGTPGEIRNYAHNSPNGVPYSQPYEIYDNLRNFFKLNLSPWDKHIVYETIHPFCDGNGRSGRIILLSDLDFDFNKTNDLIDDNYIPSLTAIMDNNHEAIKKLL